MLYEGVYICSKWGQSYFAGEIGSLNILYMPNFLLIKFQNALYYRGRKNDMFYL